MIAAAAYQDGQRDRAAIAAIAGLGSLQNVLIGFCGGNLLFGIDTTGESCTVE